MHAISIDTVSKKFGSLIAVDKISLNIEEGEIFGLLGPNGAGKTTLISILATMQDASSGHAQVWGHDVHTKKKEVRESIGIVFQDTTLDQELTARENLDFHGRLYDLPKGLRAKRIKEVMKLVDLEEKLDDLVSTFSGGMRRRLEIARGLMHRPKVLFLDEPTVGLDPQTRRKLWEYIKRFNRKEKMTIILTTHYMDEADFLCSRVGIIDHGKVVALGSSEKLKEVLGGDVITVSCTSGSLKSVLEKLPFVKKVKSFDHKMNITVANGSTAVPKIIAVAEKHKVVIESVILKRPSLEDVFIHYTGREFRDENPGEDRFTTMMRSRR